MTAAYVIADPHFGHKGVCHFTRADGTPLRPWDDVNEMDEALVENWNKTVQKNDKVYVLGDFCINRKALSIAGRLNGDKILIKGNHDIFKLEEYAKYFRDIRAYHVLAAHRVVLSHIPVHPSQLERWRLNIHGHLHSGVVMRDQAYEEYKWYTDINGNDYVEKTVKHEPDPRYKCVSVEHTNFKPILLDEVLKWSSST